MVISLYTSRIVLTTLGVDDYGIYNVVGGVVMMFTVISGSLSSSVSRFITFELGKNDIEKLHRIFCISIQIQGIIALLVLLASEIIAIWFLNNHMNIPENRLYAANWVLQFSLLSFIVSLFQVPFNSSIIAHEKMDAFAYIGIFDVSIKLGGVYILTLVPCDKLIVYSFFLFVTTCIILIVYVWYCRLHFQETRIEWIVDNKILKEIFVFAGWGFLSNTCYVINSQGINILINIFFGVAINASRGIAVQIENAIMKFVNDFTIALNPQITKNYAIGNLQDMYNLICKGSKYAYFLLLIISVPIFFEASFVLKIWLGLVPPYSESFFRLSIIGTAIALLGNTGYVGCMATGKIKIYTIIISSIGFLVFPLTFMAFSLGASPIWAYISTIVINMLLLVTRLRLMNRIFQFPIEMFLRDVLYRIFPVTIISLIIPYCLYVSLEPSFSRFLLVVSVSLITCIIFIYWVGLNEFERLFLCNQIRNKIRMK